MVLTAKDLTDEDRRRLNGHVEAILQKGAYTREELLDEVRREVRRPHPDRPVAAARRRPLG